MFRKKSAELSRLIHLFLWFSESRRDGKNTYFETKGMGSAKRKLLINAVILFLSLKKNLKRYKLLGSSFLFKRRGGDTFYSS